MLTEFSFRGILPAVRTDRDTAHLTLPALSVEILYEFFDDGGCAHYLQYLPVPLNVVNPW